MARHARAGQVREAHRVGAHTYQVALSGCCVEGYFNFANCVLFSPACSQGTFCFSDSKGLRHSNNFREKKWPYDSYTVRALVVLAANCNSVRSDWVTGCTALQGRGEINDFRPIGTHDWDVGNCVRAHPHQDCYRRPSQLCHACTAAELDCDSEFEKAVAHQVADLRC
jgi:hypothetical protein